MDTQLKLTKLLAILKVAQSLEVPLRKTKQVILDEIMKICYTCGQPACIQVQVFARPRHLCPKCAKKHKRGQLYIL